MLQGAVAKQHLQAAYSSTHRASSNSSNLTSPHNADFTQHPHQLHPQQQQRDQQQRHDQQQHAYGVFEQQPVPTAAGFGLLLQQQQQQQQEEVSGSRQDRLATISRWSVLLQGRLTELTTGGRAG
jgi:hypothetical protein